jgi:hypothetical protein
MNSATLTSLAAMIFVHRIGNPAVHANSTKDTPAAKTMVAAIMAGIESATDRTPRMR